MDRHSIGKGSAELADIRLAMDWHSIGYGLEVDWQSIDTLTGLSIDIGLAMNWLSIGIRLATDWHRIGLGLNICIGIILAFN